MEKKTILVAQLFISMMMAFLMTGIFTCLELGPTIQWLQIWAHHFLIAWPVAFVLSILVSQLGFKIAFKITRTTQA